MVNTLKLYKHLLHGLMKLIGLKTQAVEVEPGTVIHFWMPKKATNNKPSVVFLHGLGLDGILTWQFQVPALVKEYSVYVPDILFFGGSTTDKAERSPAFQAECVAKGLRKLSVENCSLVGLSYGAILGFRMAEMYPDLVESMVVTGAAMAFTDPIKCAIQARLGVDSWVDDLIPDTVKGVKKLFEIATYKLPWMPDFFCKDMIELMSENRREKLELVEGLAASGKDFSIPQYPQRIYLLWGENDKLYDMESARNLQKQLEGKAALYCIEKAGHLVQSERPFAYNTQLKKIFASFYDDRKQK